MSHRSRRESPPDVSAVVAGYKLALESDNLWTKLSCVQDRAADLLDTPSSGRQFYMIMLEDGGHEMVGPSVIRDCSCQPTHQFFRG